MSDTFYRENNDNTTESNCLWRFVDVTAMRSYTSSKSKIELEEWILGKLLRSLKTLVIEYPRVLIRQTRTGLYVNIYDRKKQVGHASFHYDENRPGSISHIVDDCDRYRDDIYMRKSKSKLKFILARRVKDIYGFLGAVAKSLTFGFTKLLHRRSELINNDDCANHEEYN